MQNEEEAVYFLTVKQAEWLADRHIAEDGWDLWRDTLAQAVGLLAMETEEESRYERAI